MSQESNKMLEGAAHFRSTFEQAAVGMAHMSRAGHLQLVNWRFCDILGYAREELMQQGFLDITHPEDVQEDLTYFKAALAGKSEPHIRETR
jgi:PAS domain S-box-containing protein